MVFFNYATMQMAAKIVYYGAGLCGKTTNLHFIYAKTSPQSRGEMVSLETETDRTLFFDLLPIDVGVIGGFKTRLQLYTIPGQVFYNTTRKLVLKGVDGIVFVADSQQAMQDANVESLQNLRENLKEIGLKLDEIPLVVQLNKRDLPNVAPVEAMLDRLDPDRKYDHIESVAATGIGVFETLKLISKLTLRTLRRRMTGDEAAPKQEPRVAAQVGTFRVKEAPKHAASESPNIGLVTIDEEVTQPSHLKAAARLDSHIIADAPVAAPPPPAPPAAPEPEVEFQQSEKPSKKTEVKHVKVRSSVDIMAELEALRKKATQSTPKAAKKEASPLDALLKSRDVQKSVALKVDAGTLAKSKAVRVSVAFENGENHEATVDLGDAANVQSLSVNLKITS